MFARRKCPLGTRSDVVHLVRRFQFGTTRSGNYVQEQNYTQLDGRMWEKRIKWALVSSHIHNDE